LQAKGKGFKRMSCKKQEETLLTSTKKENRPCDGFFFLDDNARVVEIEQK
jgi:flagellar biosynthesis chaperone FliJ